MSISSRPITRPSARNPHTRRLPPATALAPGNILERGVPAWASPAQLPSATSLSTDAAAATVGVFGGHGAKARGSYFRHGDHRPHGTRVATSSAHTAWSTPAVRITPASAEYEISRSVLPPSQTRRDALGFLDDRPFDVVEVYMRAGGDDWNWWCTSR